MGDGGKCAKTFSLPKPSRIQMEEEEARGDLHTARKRRVATLRRADSEDYENTGGSMTTLVAAGHLEHHR